MRFIVGDRVRVNTTRHGDSQYLTEGTVVEPLDTDGWHKVRFSDDEDDWNFYEPRDLDLIQSHESAIVSTDYYRAITCDE